MGGEFWPETQDMGNSSWGKRDNSKTRFIQWVMRSAAETLFVFADNSAIVSTKREPDQPNVWRFEISQNEPEEERINQCLPNPTDVRKTTRVETNMPTVGEEFGFLIISENRETKHCAQDSQWAI